MIAAASSRRFIQRLRTGLCICGRPTAAHFGSRDQFLSCDELAELDAARLSAQACTTAGTARTALELHAIATQPDPRD